VKHATALKYSSTSWKIQHNFEACEKAVFLATEFYQNRYGTWLYFIDSSAAVWRCENNKLAKKYGLKSPSLTLEIQNLYYRSRHDCDLCRTFKVPCTACNNIRLGKFLTLNFGKSLELHCSVYRVQIQTKNFKVQLIVHKFKVPSTSSSSTGSYFWTSKFVVVSEELSISKVQCFAQ